MGVLPEVEEAFRAPTLLCVVHLSDIAMICSKWFHLMMVI